MPVRPFGSFYTGARPGNTAAGHAVNACAPISPFSIYCQRLVCDGREWCPRSAARKKKTVPANDRYRNKSYAISLRWHYPNQVPGLDDTVHSQPAANQLPFFSFSIVKLSGMCVKVQGKVQGTETKGPSPNAGFMLSKTFPIGETI